MKLFRNRKQGALDLSLTTIVVLIFAITVLSLGLVFIRGLFQAATENITGAIDKGNLEIPPTNQDPFTLSSSQLNIRRGGKEDIQIGLLNRGTQRLQYRLSVDGLGPKECKGSTGSYKNFVFSPQEFPPRDIVAQGTIAWGLSIEVPNTTPDGQYFCTIVANSGTGDDAETLYEDFFINVN